jgi:uncharacterized membrane protein
MKKKLVTIFVIFQLLDVATTYIALNVFGFKEMNPLAKYLISQYGFISLLLVKILVVGVIVFAYYLVRSKSEKIITSFENSLSTGTILTICAVTVNAIGLLTAVR